MRTQHTLSSTYSMPKHTTMSSVHQSVLLQEVLHYLHIHEGDTVLDATLGGGGHAAALAKAAGTTGRLVGFDTDSAAIARAREALVYAPGTVTLIHTNFRYIDTVVSQHTLPPFNAALFDLGYSSDQLESGRGFTFLKDEPLTMTLTDAPAEYTAYDIVNSWSEQSITDILSGWGEERGGRRVRRVRCFGAWKYWPGRCLAGDGREVRHF
jgi:16S rRNA (cytosine1402-N4)-methyltransferase